MPTWPTDVPWLPGNRRVLDMPPSVRREVLLAHRARLTDPDADPLDGHRMLGRLKVAAALGIFAGHLRITEEDWRLADVVMAVSDRTRQDVLDTLRADAAHKNASTARAEAHRAVVIEEVVNEEATRRVCDRLLRRLARAAGSEEPWMSGSDLRKAIDSGNRRHVERALERLVERGQVRHEEVERRGQTGGRYRIG